MDECARCIVKDVKVANRGLILRCYSGIYVEGLRKYTKQLRIVDARPIFEREPP
jgi:hypothetical protein